MVNQALFGRVSFKQESNQEEEMSEEMATYEAKTTALGTINVTPEQVALVKSTVFKDATDDELKLYFFECRRRGVHPLDRLIHPVIRKDKDGTRRISFQTSIDLFRSEAENTGEYRGQSDVVYGELIAWDKVDKKVPEWAKATIKRYDQHTQEIIEISAVAYWEEYYPGESLGFQWRKMPRLMLGKCAEALAMRKAFPRKLAGLYTFEEIQLTDLVEQGKKITKASTVKPNNGAQQSGDNRDAKKTVRDTLIEELQAYCKNNIEKMGELLKEITLFKSAEGNEIFLTLEAIPTAKETWVGKTLGLLREKVKKEGTAGCPKNAEKCDIINFKNGIPVCEKTGGECKYV